MLKYYIPTTEVCINSIKPFHINLYARKICESHPNENIIKVKEGTFLCKKTSSFNFDDICDMFSDVGCRDKTIIISPGYNYDFSSPYFEVKCTV